MREVKFRAWLTDKRKEMISFERIYRIHFREDGAFALTFADTLGNGVALHGDFVLMQSTGLKDKNGKEIYEGDILRLFNEDDEPLHDCGPVVFNDAAFWIRFTDNRQLELYIDHDMYAVIGNIYENPELLEGI